MAKYGVTNVAGGGGIGSDELSVTKDYVLNGKTYVGTDTNDEIGTGTMANNGTTANQSLNAGGSFQVKKGYHAQDFSVNANSLASQTSGTATSGHILSGQTAWVNGAKVNGGIPLQNAEVAGTDRAWAQGMSNWAGTINLKVRNGHYLNGVNWIQQDISNFRPENIKKGVNIGGVTGTWEGYVPGVQDLYYYGQNVAGLISSSTRNIKFDSGQITIDGTANAGGNSQSAYTPNINLVGKSYVNILYSVSVQETGGSFIFGVTAADQRGGSSSTNSYLAAAEHPITVGNNKTMTVALHNLQGVFRIAFSSYFRSSDKWKAAVQRIWFS